MIDLLARAPVVGYPRVPVYILSGEPRPQNR